MNAKEQLIDLINNLSLEEEDKRWWLDNLNHYGPAVFKVFLGLFVECPL